MPVVSISLTRELLEKLDELARRKGYSSRSEAVRDAIREILSEYELSKLEKGRVIATITVISEHERHDVDERLMRLRHEHDDIVSGNMHIHLEKTYCLEIFITEGDVADVLNFIGKIRAMRGIQQVKYTLVPIVVEGSIGER
ncbi:TPA: nickel-responsive transcriptional regulator NikR [Candidatus Bathyarchaeota archaeon]|nr:nickel-responsive transcriptional regulator NikR [Candidatus Bathyarchaeota archaeon]